MIQNIIYFQNLTLIHVQYVPAQLPKLVFLFLQHASYAAHSVLVLAL